MMTQGYQTTTQQTRINTEIPETYDQYESAIHLLKKGFEATKFNFSNMNTRKVRVFLS